MNGLNDAPPIMVADPAYVHALVPSRHLAMVLDLWMEKSIPMASMKMENDLRKAIGITYTFAGFRYDTRRRRQAVEQICAAAGNPDAADVVLRASNAVKRVLGLVSIPIEVMGFDVSPREVRQIKAYIRTNISHERFEDRVMACDGTTPADERRAVEAVLAVVAPHRTTSVLGILESLQTTKGALEGIAIDLEEDRADIKLYFLPRRSGDVGETYTDEQTIEFIDRSLDMFGLGQHRSRAHRMVAEMTAIGLKSSFLAVEEKPDGSHELKVDFNTARSGAAFPGRRVPPAAAADAIRAAYRAAAIEPDEPALASLTEMVGPQGILLDDFTTDFGADGCSGKVYLRAGADLGTGVYAAGAVPLT